MKTILHRADTRGHANHGWLDSYHTFSFAGYYDPERVHFGALRVLNDDVVKPGMGFGAHPHDNMEIVSIPLSGDLAHKDSEGNGGTISEGDVQIMSAGTGIVHSEMNPSPSREVNFLQIWVFPLKRGIKPRYGQKNFSLAERKNRLQTVVSPDGPESLWINQEAWFSLSQLDANQRITYTMNRPESGLYIFVISGSLDAAGTNLARRDGLGVWDTGQIELSARVDSEILLMEVPMNPSV